MGQEEALIELTPLAGAPGFSEDQLPDRLVWLLLGGAGSGVKTLNAMRTSSNGSELDTGVSRVWACRRKRTHDNNNNIRLNSNIAKVGVESSNLFARSSRDS